MDLASLSLPYGWSAIDAGQRFVAALFLLAIFIWSSRTALSDVAWARKTSSKEAIEKAGYSRTNHELKNPQTAQKHIDNLDSYVTVWVDAARARQARMIFSGIVMPALILLIFLASYSWFLPDRCVTTARPCVLSAGDGLLFASANIVIGLLADLDWLFALSGANHSSLPTEIIKGSDDKIISVAAIVARYYTYVVLSAAGLIELTICRFKAYNQQKRSDLEKITTPSLAYAANAVDSASDDLAVQQAA